MKELLGGQIDLHRLFARDEPSGFVDSLLLRGASVAKDADIACILVGSPGLADGDIAPQLGDAKGLLVAWRKHGVGVTSLLHGGYACVIVDATRECVFLAVDRFAIQTICYCVNDRSLTFSDRADRVEGAGGEIEPQAVFDYLYFHMIPAPRTIFANVRRLPAAHNLLVDRQGVQLRRHWLPKFSEAHRPSFSSARTKLHQLLTGAVKDEIGENIRVGAFLSGGTDSSTVAGMLCRITGSAAPTYSIGFEAEGYDEMEYARLAARHFGSEHHEYYVTPADVLASIPAVAQYHDQPFGNSSALPAYYCAKMAAADGCTKMLAGDGGDELFGGNTRYATQRFLNFYHSVPLGIRQAIEPMCGDDSILRRIPVIRQATGYVRHSRAPLPHRLQSMNLLMQLGPANVFKPEFLARIDVSSPARQMQGTWDECDAKNIVNQMLAYDWRYTLADSDLHKVRGATAMAGVALGYPLLSDALVDFSMALPPDWKLRGFKLRWFFKESMRGFLPDEIIKKKKQGFGLPHGLWMVRNPELRKLARDSLHALADRGIVQNQFVTKLVDEHLDEHPGYYGEMVWILMMLEQWLQGQTKVNLPY